MSSLLGERGVIIGKFMPPHAGHLHLAQFARPLVRRLYVVLCSLEQEPIAGRLREAWLRECLPWAEVLHLTEELPATPEGHADFWPRWRAALLQILPEAPDLLFASESYGDRLAGELGARWLPVDLGRDALGVSGSDVRRDPWTFWPFLPAPVRAYYVRRVTLFGPESTGKTTLAQALAARLKTLWVPEFARSYLEQKAGDLCEDDLITIAAGQKAAEDSLARQAERLLICDTDALSTKIWACQLYGRVDARIEALAAEEAKDLYLLCSPDLPWVADRVRYLPQAGAKFFEACRNELAARGLRYRVVSGVGERRLDSALSAVKETLGEVMHGKR